jgi:hypothetical protein
MYKDRKINLVGPAKKYCKKRRLFERNISDESFCHQEPGVVFT